jgi:hypothetical protein
MKEITQNVAIEITKLLQVPRLGTCLLLGIKHTVSKFLGTKIRVWREVVVSLEGDFHEVEVTFGMS